MTSRNRMQFLLLVLAVLAIALTVVSCGGSKANVRPEANGSPAPSAVDVTTATAIRRDLPRYFEATGSLAADVQTDVQPQTSGKVVAIGVDMGSVVRRGQ